METHFTGRVWKLGDDIDTDIIMPTQWLTLDTMDEVKRHAFEPLRPELAAAIRPGDILVAGWNFGCGSSREQAAEALAALHLRCIIAKSYGRIFFRNAINNGLLLIESQDLPDHCAEGDSITVDMGRSVSCNDQSFPIPRMPENVLRIIEDGGLVRHMQKRNGILGKAGR